MRRDLRQMLLWLSAANREALEHCPGEATRFVAAGGTVLTTTAMAALAGWFAAHALLRLGAPGALLFGVGWGLAIMNLERYLQSSIRRQSSSVRTLMMAAPRLALAYLLGLVISTPLLIAVFHPEVTAQVEVDRNEEVASARSALKRQYAAVPVLQVREQKLEQEVTTPFAVGTVLAITPEYRGMVKRYSKYKAAAEMAPNARAATADEHAASVTLGQMLPLRRELLAQEAEDNANRGANERQTLRNVRVELQPLQALLERKESAVEHLFHAPSGYADQVRALGRLVANNASIGSEKTNLWLFILAIDSLPALLKTLMCTGRRTLYERTPRTNSRRAPWKRRKWPPGHRLRKRNARLPRSTRSRPRLGARGSPAS
jgi:Domain of unknown function (DUF4407)